MEVSYVDQVIIARKVRLLNAQLEGIHQVIVLKFVIYALKANCAMKQA